MAKSSTRFERIVSAFAIVAAAAGLAGCGAPASDSGVSPVKGRVFLGDEPLEFGTVVFQPVSGGQPAQGDIESDGSFTLSTYKPGDGAAAGKHRVRVVSYTSQAPDATAEQKRSDALGDLLVPSKYANFATSGIEVSVLKGGNAPFILKLEPGEPPEADPEAEPAEEPAVSEEPAEEGETDVEEPADEE